MSVLTMKWSNIIVHRCHRLSTKLHHAAAYLSYFQDCGLNFVLLLVTLDFVLFLRTLFPLWWSVKKKKKKKHLICPPLYSQCGNKTATWMKYINSALQYRYGLYSRCCHLQRWLLQISNFIGRQIKTLIPVWGWP